MDERFKRTEMLLGRSGAARLENSRVLLFGLGGVGSAAFEALCRAGVGRLDIVDGDEVALSNINRQLIALSSTVGMRKTAAAAARGRDINPAADIREFDMFVTAENIDAFDFSQYGFVLDAIDTVASKLLIAEECAASGTPLISCMGTGGKLRPELLRTGDIFETSGCPLARVMRKELRRRNIRSMRVVWSPEEPNAPETDDCEMKGRAPVPGTVSFVPPTAGYIMASEAVLYLSGKGGNVKNTVIMDK